MKNNNKEYNTVDKLYNNIKIMISIFNKLRLENLKNSLKEVWIRFPIWVITIIITFLLFFYQINVSSIADYIQDILFKTIISTIVVFFLSIAIWLMNETLKITKLNNYLYQSSSIIFWLVFYYFFWGQSFKYFWSEEIIYIFLIFVWIISFLFFSPFVKNIIEKKFSQDSYYNYFLSISFTFLISFFLWGALTILWFIWLWAIFTLFELKWLNQGDFFSYFANFSLALCTPLFFLSQLPNKILKEKEIYTHNFFKFLIKFVGIPFIFIYFLILYAYTVKVLSNFDNWPQWEVSWMVIWFSIFWYLIYIFSYELENNNKAIMNFRKFFPFVVIPQIIMLFYAIYLRINQYDFTINRYFVVVFGLWLLVISLYLIISKQKLLAFISMILFDFIIIVSVWPWSVYNFPESRQTNILKDKLIESNILAWTQINIPKDSSQIDPKLSWEIYDIIWYLVNNHWTKSVENFFPTLISEIRLEDKVEWENDNTKYDNREYTWISSWTFIYKLRDKLKVEPYYSWEAVERKYISYRVVYEKRDNIIDIKWYDYLSEIVTKFKDTSLNNAYTVLIDTEKEELKISKNDELVEEFEIKEFFKSLNELSKEKIDRYWSIELEEPIVIEKTWKNIDVKLIIYDFSLLNPNYTWNETYINEDINWKLLIREK